ncbi:hypothetical protein [Silvibacterium bohemicum]|nr:hypothetical protein [Silvibacterium bohemicum]
MGESRKREAKTLECGGYGGSNPPLCTRDWEGSVGMVFEGVRRKVVALAMLGVLAAVAWRTMDAGRVRTLVFVLLGGFALRVTLTPGRSRYDGEGSPD